MMVFRFSKRHREFLTSDGTFENKMPPHLETRINTFRSVLAQLHREKQFPAFQVGAMDELSLHWGQVVERRNGGVLRHHGMETSSCSVILAATADGNLLPPFLVIKDCDTALTTDTNTSVKKEQEEEEDVEDCEEAEEENEVRLLRCGMTCGLKVAGEGAVVGEKEIATWLSEVWFRHVPQSNFLLADSYNVHTAQHTQKLLLEVRHTSSERRKFMFVFYCSY